MKNIEAGVGAVPTQEKKVVDEEEEVEEEHHQMVNEMVFFLSEAPEYQISAVAEWAENSRGDIVVEADTYFLHVMTGQRCESARECLDGWSESDENSMEKWDTLYYRIRTMLIRDLRRIVCGEKKYEIHPI